MCDDAARQDPGSGAVAGVVRAIAQGMEMKEEEQAALDSFVAGEDVEAIASSRRIDAALVLAQLARAAAADSESSRSHWARLPSRSVTGLGTVRDVLSKLAMA